MSGTDTSSSKSLWSFIKSDTKQLELRTPETLEGFISERVKMIPVGIISQIVEQRYEGGSTINGPHTLDAYIYVYKNLSKAMAMRSPAPLGPNPPDLMSKQLTFLPPVVFDEAGFGHTAATETIHSECLDDIGYSIERVHRRKEINKTLDEIYNKRGYSDVCITTGAKGEGTGLYFESDIDRMYVLKDVQCIWPEEEYSASTVFQLETDGSAAGYTRLKLIRPAKIECVRDEVRKFLKEQNGSVYIGNNFTLYVQKDYGKDIHEQLLHKEHEKHGPATTYRSENVEYDIVPALTCAFTELLKTWAERPRQHDWPPECVIAKISQLEGHVVPVANKDSLYPDTEWRISFAKADLCLMHCLSEPQTKLYLLLKFVSKATLEPLCKKKSISTYILKNVLFWMFEEKPLDYFTLETLLDRLVEALKRIRHHIRSDELKCYMIPDKNLLYGRITESKRRNVIKELDAIISDRQNMFSKCSKLKNALTMRKDSPEEMKTERIKREAIEDLLCKRNVIYKSAECLAMEPESGSVWTFESRLEDNDEYMAIVRELQNVIIPDEREREELGPHLEKEVIKRTTQVLS